MCVRALGMGVLAVPRVKAACGKSPRRRGDWLVRRGGWSVRDDQRTTYGENMRQLLARRADGK